MNTHVEEQPLFHVMDDVAVPSAHEFGYVFAVSESENMLLVKTFDGKNEGWYHPEELQHLTLESGAKLLELVEDDDEDSGVVVVTSKQRKQFSSWLALALGHRKTA